jgi:2-polyprenyl-6-methoxyphenol hydroxylase-like FAD-dependent oxidoreductase
MSGRNVIVSGGGLGGLAVAAGLCQTGWRVTVFEQAPQFAPLGAGITLAPNAIRALDWLGVGTALRQRSVATGAAGLRTPSGRWLLRTTVDELTARQGLPAYALHRADLHMMLLDAAADADLCTGHRVTHVSTDANGADVHYVTADGPNTARADLAVAADGVHSWSRQALFPSHPGWSYADYITWRGVAPADAAPAQLPGITATYGRGEAFGVVPLADGRVYWFAAAIGPQHTGVNDDINDLAARFAGWHEPIPALLAATPAEALLRHPIHHLATPLPTYVTGRVALLGDAAHAMTPDLGQGAAQALEDAVVLSARLAGATDVGPALAGYNADRRERTQKMVRASARVGRLMAGRTAIGAWLRDAITWALPAAAFMRATDDAFGWRPPVLPPAVGSARAVGRKD